MADISLRGTQIDTPNIDALAQSGLLFNQHYVQVRHCPPMLLLFVDWLQPICSPTRSALMTATCVLLTECTSHPIAPRYPYRMGLAHQVICNGQTEGVPLDRTLLPQVLQDANYSTHAIGKWDVRTCLTWPAWHLTVLWQIGYSRWEYTPTYRGFDSFIGYYLANEDRL